MSYSLVIQDVFQGLIATGYDVPEKVHCFFNQVSLFSTSLEGL
jgi:hypothetical protein